MEFPINPCEKIREQMNVTQEEYKEYLKQFTQDGKHLIYTTKEDVYEIYCMEVQGEEKIITMKLL